ncbi:myb-binding protein 1A-like protein isoform X3 [Thalassophryne amazonica]|uniref:myb-binding protein 1A-like protein isoform X3 n=1 Tax=Thalassophryne amazonica TaxID=390379 RepID=UPI001471DB4A|nr:myb-binding protein 1A-like protein isoform X3 [Thalassophryne amazonica]
MEVRTAALLHSGRVFLDLFWDIAKPDQEVRLKAVEDLIRYLRTSSKDDEMDYTLKRLVDGLAHTREAARPGFSLALGQVLGAFEDLSLQTTLDRIKDKHNLQTVKKKRVRNAMFGNLFGVLALHQSGRLFKEPPVVLGCVQLLQSLSQHRQHLKDLPSKTMMDILSEIPEEVFEEVLLEALQTDLASAFRTPEQLHLLLVALQRFPHTLKPKKLKKLLGTSTIINMDNIPKLTEVLKMAAHSVKKDCILPPVAMDLLKLSLKEDSFQLFWNKAITEGMLKEAPGPTRYLGMRLLGAALPLLSLDQLKQVLTGDVMRLYGEHVVSAQKAERFRLAPEMDTYVSDFLQSCPDPDKQLAVMVGFSSLTNQGYPVVSPAWKVVQYTQLRALQLYVEWLKIMFLQPRLDQLLDFSTRRQKDHQEACEGEQKAVFRLRKWIIDRLCSIIDNHQVKKDQDLVMGVSRFVLFHTFFTAKKKLTDVPETEGQLSVPLGDDTRGVLASSFFGLLLSLDHLPLTEDAAAAAVHPKRMLGATGDGTMWLYHLAQYADVLLNQPKSCHSCQPFTCEQTHAWTSMLQSVRSLQAVKKAAGSRAFQQLFLLLGLHLFKAPEELLDTMKDLHRCLDKAQEKKSEKKQEVGQEEEPEWVEVMVDTLLSLLSLPSRHIRLVCKTVFSSICPDITEAALGAIMDVLDPEKDEEESAVVVTDDGVAHRNQSDSEGDPDDEMEDDDKSEDDSDGDDEALEEVDQSFRLDLMKVLQQKNTLATSGDSSSDDELDDEAMMELDKSLAMLFSEQKKKNQDKKDKKSKLHKKKMLVRNFKMKVLDLVEVFVARQAGSPLVLSLVEPLLTIIDRGMSSDNDQLEQDFLRRVADILSNKLYRSKVYCRTIGDRQGALHDLVEKLMAKGRQLSDSSVCLYYFSGCLYLMKVLRGAPAADNKDQQTTDRVLQFMGNMDEERVSAVFREALKSFLSRRRSPLTTQMFTDLFSRFPVVCVKVLDMAVEHVTSGVRPHQQSQACVLVLRAMQMRQIQVLVAGAEWAELCVKVIGQLAATLKQVGGSKVEKEKLLKNLQLCQFLLKNVQQQKLTVELEPLQVALQALPALITFKKSSQLEDLYWNVMKHFGIMKPKAEKTSSNQEVQQEEVKKKKKGFLPESKKRKRRQKTPEDTQMSTDQRQSKKQKSANKRKHHVTGGATAPQPGLAKKRKMQPKTKPMKKKQQQHKV